MKAIEVRVALAVAGSIAALVACSSAGDEGVTLKHSTGKGGTSSLGSAGSETSNGSSGSGQAGGNVNGAAGTSSQGSAGTGNQGSGGTGNQGTGGSAPPGAGGSAPAGAGGSGGSNVACTAVPDVGVMPIGAIINDMEAGTAIQTTATPGYWYTYNDMTVGATQTPVVNGTFVTAQLVPPRGASTYAVHTTGSGFTGWGAGMGFNFIGPKMSTVDASKYKGVTFYAKGTGSVRVNVLTKATAPEGCVCGSQPKGCFDHFSVLKTLTSGFTQFNINWADLAQQGYGAPATFDPKTLLGMNFQSLNPSTTFPSASPYSVDFWIDDIAFIP